MQRIVIEISDTDEIPVNAMPFSEVLEDIKTEIESINNWSIRYAPAEDKDKRAQIVANVKKHIISIVDKHISEKER